MGGKALRLFRTSTRPGAKGGWDAFINEAVITLMVGLEGFEPLWSEEHRVVVKEIVHLE